MRAERIVSFLPAATEMVCALGCVDRLAGITHECDFPPEAAASKPVVVRSALQLDGLSSSEIDSAVRERLRTGASLYEVDEERMRELSPDLIITQNLCQVCAPSGNEAAALLKSLQPEPEILWLSPQSLADIEQNIREVGNSIGATAEAETIIAGHRHRINDLKQKTGGIKRRPKVAFLEWIDPVYNAGHWVPKMIELAGGIDLLGHAGADSIRVPWEKIEAAKPDIMILSPCGFNLEKSLPHVQKIVENPGWENLSAVRQGRVYAVDANAYFARPGTRIIDGIELLAHLFHPDDFDWKGPANAFRKIEP